MPIGPLPLVGSAYSVMAPVGVIAALLASSHLGEPDIAIGASGDSPGIAPGGRDRIFGDLASGSDLPDLVGAIFREPEVAIVPLSDDYRETACSGKSVLGDDPTGSDLVDLVPIFQGEPEIASWAGGNAPRTPTVRERIFGHHPTCGGGADLVGGGLGKPEPAVVPSGDAAWETAECWRPIFGKGASDLGRCVRSEEHTSE